MDRTAPGAGESTELPEPERFDLFPTRLLTFQFADRGLDAALARAFDTDPAWARDDQAEGADRADLSGRTDPAFAKLRAMFLEAARAYCRSVGWRGRFDLRLQMFPNVAPAGHTVPAHNHVAHIAAVYYVRVPESVRPAVVHDGTMADYWRQDPGALILHDPRFNASLLGGWEHHAKIFPRNGLMVMFPAFLWHSVAPHSGGETRLSVAANFLLERADIPPYDTAMPFEA